MAGLIDWLNSTAVHLWGVDVSWAEVLGDLTGLASVWWAAREKVWTWPVGNLNSALFLVLFLDAKLYASSVLQLVFIALGFFGWWEWVRRHGPDRRPLVVSRATPLQWVGIGVAGSAVLVSWTWWLAAHTDSPQPFWDSAILAVSLVATYGQARKLLESWWLWILVDVISVPLYLSRGLVPTAAVYAIFGALCVMGLREWRAELRSTTTLDPAQAVA